MIFYKYTVFRRFINSLLKHHRLRVFISISITVFLGLTKGASLIILLPLLRLAGITESAGQSSRVAQMVNTVWGMLGISISLYSCLILYVLFVLLYAVLGYFKTLLDTEIVQTYKQQLRNELFSAVIKAEWGYIKNKKHTHIFNNLITEINNIGYAAQMLVYSFGTVIIFCFYLTTSLYVSFKMTIVASLCFLPLLIIQKKLNSKAYATGEIIYQRHEHLFSAVLEFINSFKIAKTYNLQNRYELEFKEITQQTTKDEYSFSKISAGTEILYEVGSAIIISLVLVLAITIVKIPIVDLLLMVYIASKLLPNISSLTRNFQYILNTLPSFEGVFNLMDQAHQNKEQHSTTTLPFNFPEKSIKFSSIGFHYEDDVPIFENFSCEIQINKTTSIIGRSGRGKSTLMELLLGLLKVQDGKILIDNVDLARSDRVAWRNSIAYIPQECFLFNATIRQNLLWSKPDASESELREVLQGVAGEFVFNLPNGLETVVGDQGIRLSGGERQRIVLARALLRNPKILILDEATNALDTDSESVIKRAIGQLKGKVTVLIISHDQHLVDEADDIIRID